MYGPFPPFSASEAHLEIATRHTITYLKDDILIKELFCTFDHIPVLPERVIQDAIDGSYEVLDMPNVVRAPTISFIETDFFKNFNNNLGRTNAVYLKNFPHSVYDWHTDINRTCAVNWVIKTTPKASTLYATPYDDDVLYHNRRRSGRPVLFYHLDEVQYVLHKPTLMDTTQRHCVINNSPEERIILSMVPFESSYEEVKKYLNSLNITEY